MKLFGALFFIVLFTILQLINASSLHLYREKTAKKWFAVAILHPVGYVVRQACIQMYFVPQKDDIWTAIMVEYFQEIDFTLVESKNMTARELDRNHITGSQELEKSMDFLSDRHLLFFESDREIYIILSRVIDDDLFNGVGTFLFHWVLKPLPSFSYLQNINTTDSDLICGTNRGGKLDLLRDVLTEAVVNWVGGLWYAVAILRNYDLNEDLSCIEKYFIQQDDTVNYLTIQNGAPGTSSQLFSGDILSKTMFDIYSQNIDHLYSLLNFDDNDYFFMVENPDSFYILSRSSNVNISLSDEALFNTDMNWTLQLLNQENCVYYTEPTTPDPTDLTNVIVEVEKKPEDCEDRLITKLCQIITEILKLPSKAFHFAYENGSLFKLLRRLFGKESS